MTLRLAHNPDRVYMNHRLILLIPVFILILTLTLAAAEPKGNVHPNLKLGFTERFRLVTWDNAITLDDEAGGASTFTRHRTSLKGQWFPVDDMEFCLKLTNEFRYYLDPADREFNSDEVFVDNLYFKYQPPGFPGTFTLGRQNIILGEGFLVFDGTPLVGSRSMYFNAVRYDHRLGPERSLMLFAATQTDKEEYLPRLDDRDARLLEHDQTIFGLYATGNVGCSDVEVYYLNMRHGLEDGNTTVHTFGTRIVRPLSERLAGTIEISAQRGSIPFGKRTAYGGHCHFDYTTGWGRYAPSKLTLGGVYLGGDDPSTANWEAWDPLFARWPKWSESYIYTQIREDGVAWWSNYASIWGCLEFDLGADTRFRFDYHHLMALQRGTIPAEMRGDGKRRGELYIGKLIYRVNERLTGHLLWEGFSPGSFYFEGAYSYAWIRAELMLTID